MPVGKYFYVKSKLNGLHLDVKGDSRSAGTPVITWHPKEKGQSENQLWYEDHLTGSIRSKLNNLCLDISDDNALVVNTFQSGKDSQQWLTSGDRIQNRKEHDKVIDLAGENKSPGARVCAWKAHGGLNQQWTFEYIPAKYFYIRSKMHGKVIDVKKRSMEPGAKAVMMDKESSQDNQLWYEDKHGIISNKLNNFVMETFDDNKIRLQPFEPGNKEQLWTLTGERIVSRTESDKVLNIKGEETKNGAKLMSKKWKDEEHQKWVIDYV